MADAQTMAAPTGRRGTFLSLEGIDGCGKSMQAALLADRLEAAGHEVVRLREPGGTAISEKIRKILLDPENGAMADEVIEPALARGAVVVCDRYLDSTYAYQAGGRGLDAALVVRCNELGSCGVLPDRTLVLDLDCEDALARATAGGADRLEQEGMRFQERVRAAYLRLAKAEPARVRVVDAAGSVEDVAGRVDAALRDVVPCGCGNAGAAHE